MIDSINAAEPLEALPHNISDQGKNVGENAKRQLYA